ncbi:hybrid polyketide synthetase [Mactra antiquata]
MKGLLVVDRLNDIHFIDTDKEFARHINGEAKEMGFIGDNVQDMTKIDPNIVMQQFSPLFMSQWFMIDHANNPCSSITTDNFLFVFRQYEDFLIIAINGDGTESEDFLKRKTLVFISVIGFTIGPVSEEIGRPKFVSKAERWNFLRLLISTWTYLALNEQSFLVEAVEKLHMNQSMNVSEKCVDKLQIAINKLREAGERNTQHALLLVHSKLLALYSNRNAPELMSSDILCISLLIRSLFPTHDKIEDLFAQTYNSSSITRHDALSPSTIKVPIPYRERYESAVEGFMTGDETENEEYFSAFEGKQWDDSSPRLFGSANTERSSDSGSEKPAYPEVSESYVTPTTSPSHLSESVPKDQSRTKVPDLKMTLNMFRTVTSRISALTDRVVGGERPRSHTLGEIEPLTNTDDDKDTKDSVGRGRSRSFGEVNRKEGHLCSHTHGSDQRLHDTGEDDDSIFNIKRDDVDYIKQTVFLSTSLCKYTPYHIHCQKIFPGIILVVLCESPKLSQANKLVQMFQLIKELLKEHRETINVSQGQFMYETINTHLSKLLLSLRKARGHLETVCMNIKKKWETDDVRGSLLSYLEQNVRTELPPSLERSLKYILSKLTEIFLLLYLSPRPPTQEVVAALDTIKSLFVEELIDWKEFLIVKAQRNITMTTYITEFPGLVHFIYVNRRTNQMLAPSLNITTHSTDESNYLDATQLLKDKIWNVMSWMHQKLHEGHMTVLARDGDYFYSYFLWFENTSGAPEAIQKPYRADCTAPPPGILTGNFYKYVTLKCFPNAVRNTIHGKELFMMHVGLTNSHYVANHCRQLAARLNTLSGDMLTNISVFAT